MKGLGIPKFPNRFCSLWVAGLLALPVGVAAAAEESCLGSEACNNAAEQIEQDYAAKLDAARKAAAEADELAGNGKYSDADASYERAEFILASLSGDAAKSERAAVSLARANMKNAWWQAIMLEAKDLANAGNYSDAVRKASDALMVNESKIDEVNNFISFCQTRVKAEAFRQKTSASAVIPKLLSDEEQIGLLFREADIYERAYRYTEAERKIQEVFLIDPMNWDANVKLRRIYNKLYGAAKLQSDGVLRGISANSSWVYVPQVVANKVSFEPKDTMREYSSSGDLYGRLADIKVNAVYETSTIYDVIDEQNRNLTREAPDLNASILMQFPPQIGEALPKITMEVNQIPLTDLLRYVCLQTGLKMKVEERAVVLGLSSMDDLSTRRFSISAEMIQDIAESANPYYHLGNVLLAAEDGGGGGGAGGAGGAGAMGGGAMGAGAMGAGAMGGGAMGGGAMGGGAMGPEGMDMMGMMGMGMGMGMGGKKNTADDSGRISASTMISTAQANSASTYQSGVAQGLGSLGLSMDSLGIDTSNDGGSSKDYNEMGKVGAATPPLTTQSMINYFRSRGIEFPDNATITYNRRKGEILVTNTVDNLRKMGDLLALLDAVRAPMVQVEAKMVEIADTDVKELGFDWYLNINQNDATSHWNVPNNENPLRHYNDSDANSSLSTEKDYKVINNLKIFPNFGESLFGKNSNVNLSLSVNALDQSDRTEVLTSAKLLLTSGDLGLIKSVENWKFPDSWEAPEIEIDNNTVEITMPIPEFDDGNEIGTVFACRPIVNPDNYTISLYIYPQVTAYVGHQDSTYPVKLEAGTIYTSTSTGTTGTTTTSSKVPIISTNVDMWMPEFTVREMEVNVQVYDGATVVLGGMTEQYNTQRDDKWPVIGEIPLLGRLFSSQMEMHEKRSLLIFVTARLMNTDGTPWRSREPFGVPDFIW